MPLVEKDSLRIALKRREIAPVYALFGAESYLRDLAVRTICDLSFTAGDARDFNETEFSLNTQGNLTAALAAAEQLPMMSQRRVIKITDTRVAASPAKDTLREEEEESLAAYLKNPSPFSVVIFVVEEFDKRRRMAKLLIEHAAAVEFYELEDQELAKWAREKISDTGSEIDESSFRLLVSLVGPDLRRLTHEIAKLSTAALPDKVISSDLIEALVANSREIPNFDLTDHLVAGRPKEAMRVLKKILDDGSEPLALLGLISYNFRRLLMVKDAMSHGVDQGEIARIAKLRYSDKVRFLEAARRAPADKLTRAIDLLAKTDLAIKTSIGGSGPPAARMQIEMLVADLARLN